MPNISPKRKSKTIPQVKQVLLLLVLIPVLGFTHGKQTHDQEMPGKSVTVDDNSKSEAEADVKNGTATQGSNKSVSLSDFSFAEFPTLHPLIVHLPVTLIPVAFIVMLVGLFIKDSTQTIAISTGLTVTGLISGIIAAFPLHPHTENLPNAALYTLKKHDLFAYTTLGLTTVASLLLLLLCVRKLQTKLLKMVTLSVLLFATLSVAITGHYGGILAYVHGVGPTGQYLEKNH